MGWVERCPCARGRGRRCGGRARYCTQVAGLRRIGLCRGRKARGDESTLHEGRLHLSELEFGIPVVHVSLGGGPATRGLPPAPEVGPSVRRCGGE